MDQVTSRANLPMKIVSFRDAFVDETAFLPKKYSVNGRVIEAPYGLCRDGLNVGQAEPFGIDMVKPWLDQQGLIIPPTEPTVPFVSRAVPIGRLNDTGLSLPQHPTTHAFSIGLETMAIPIGTTSFERFQERAGRRSRPNANRVLVCVHGYNADAGRCVAQYQKIANAADAIGARRDIKYVGAIGVLWPGSYSPTLGWFLAQSRVKEAASRLRSVLRLLLEMGFNVDVSAHSLGCKVVAQALLGAPGERSWIGDLTCLRNVVLAAAAVPNNFQVKRYMVASEPITEAVPFSFDCPDRTVVLYSRRDPVLRYGYRLDPRHLLRPALGYSGPSKDAVNGAIESYDWSDLVRSHSGYTKQGSMDAYANLLAR